MKANTMRTLAGVAILAAGVAFARAPALADGHLSEAARANIAAFVEGVIAGPDTVAPLLVPEFQIMRSNGVGYDRAGYAGRGATSVNARPNYTLTDIVATGDGDVMVTRYFLEISETIDGQAVTRRAPRMTVFRKIGGAWKVSAHANFAHVGQ
jgi:hypothetical protein